MKLLNFLEIYNFNYRNVEAKKSVGALYFKIYQFNAQQLFI